MCQIRYASYLPERSAEESLVRQQKSPSNLTSEPGTYRFEKSTNVVIEHRLLYRTCDCYKTLISSPCTKYGILSGHTETAVVASFGNFKDVFYYFNCIWIKLDNHHILYVNVVQKTSSCKNRSHFFIHIGERGSWSLQKEWKRGDWTPCTNRM